MSGLAKGPCPRGRAGTGGRAGAEGQAPPSDQDLVASDYYRDWLRPLELRHSITVVRTLANDTISYLSLLRPAHAGPFGSVESRLLQALIPHMQDALRIHLKIGNLVFERHAMAEALEHVPFGVVLLDARGSVALVNRLARDVFEDHDGLVLLGNGFRAARRDETNDLARRILEASRRGDECGPAIGGSMLVSRPSLRRSYSVTIAPLDSASGLSLEEPRTACAVFISDPERGPRSEPAHLRERYGFTAAEALVAARLLAGNSVEDAAETLGTTVNTTRTHVRHLFEKTDTHRQGDLLRVLLLDCLSLERH